MRTTALTVLVVTSAVSAVAFAALVLTMLARDAYPSPWLLLAIAVTGGNGFIGGATVVLVDLLTPPPPRERYAPRHRGDR